jgi:hypothetical protein
MSYSTKLHWHDGPDHGWWVELLKASRRLHEPRRVGVTRRDAAGD